MDYDKTVIYRCSIQRLVRGKACDQSNGWGEEMSSYKEILDLRITCADERLFPPVDYVTVGADKGMTVVFRDGTEVRG